MKTDQNFMHFVSLWKNKNLKKTISILILELTFFKVYSQISIGNSFLPNNDVILDLINLNNRALLLPFKTN